MQAFKVGQTVTARVIGSRPLDGLAVVSLQPSVVSQTLMSYAELAPGHKVDVPPVQAIMPCLSSVARVSLLSIVNVIWKIVGGLYLLWRFQVWAHEHSL